LSDLKDKYVEIMKQQESTLLKLKASEEGFRGFDFICINSERGAMRLAHEQCA
jgi:hypothetical protein